MKTIQEVPIWANGKTQQAKILNTYAFDVKLNTSATFYYSLLAETEDGNIGVKLSEGNIFMPTDEYVKWGENDDYAWDFVANSLGLTITGDYVAPVIPDPIVDVTEQPIINNNVSETL